MADAPGAQTIRRTFDRRNRALAALAALDGPTLARAFRHPRFGEVIEQVMAAEDAATWAVKAVGVVPVPLTPAPLSGNGRQPAEP